MIGKLSNPLLLASALSAAVLLLANPAVSAQTHGVTSSDDVTAEDYTIYNTVLNEVRFAKTADLLILDDTLDFECGTDSQQPILLNGCSPMVMPPNTPKEINQLLRQNWPDMAKQTWDNFEKVNAKSAKLRDNFLTTCKHELIGDDVAAHNSNKSDSPNGAFYFSRVGFNPSRTEAIVYAFFASYVEGVHSTGDYFLLHLNKSKKWELSARINAIESNGKGN